MAADYRGLGFDPAPGSTDAVSAAAAACSGAATRLDAAASMNVDLPEAWSGDAAETLAEHALRSRAALDPAPAPLRAAADVLDGWAGTLVANQRKAEQLDRRALSLRRAVTDASDEVEAAATAAQFATGSAAAPAEAAMTAASTRHEDLERELERVLDEARVLERDHTAEATRVARRLGALGEGDTAAAAAIPDRERLFGGLTRKLDTFSVVGHELGATLARVPREAVTPPSGAVGAFAAALARPQGGR
ncbi:hypothetical protein [Amycolatopsis sp. H20-H5]|uniref:hypothetical protein n=1 Tax=Amycolatopsis sp. H20-H5 TaxID=3046309 RepID=UPI002DB74697|nr:hypothetical protein [Amycolatopsis sp. H20-H5]MEC3976720.1 hypothetical protein [Amycolatopsis sp. H20-H5]